LLAPGLLKGNQGGSALKSWSIGSHNHDGLLTCLLDEVRSGTTLHHLAHDKRRVLGHGGDDASLVDDDGLLACHGGEGGHGRGLHGGSHPGTTALGGVDVSCLGRFGEQLGLFAPLVWSDGNRLLGRNRLQFSGLRTSRETLH